MRKLKLALVTVGGVSVGFVACGPDAGVQESTSRHESGFSDVLAAIVDGTSEGTLTTAEAVEMARNAGLAVESGAADGEEGLLYFVNPETSEKLLSMSMVPDLKANPATATDPLVGGKPDASGAISCTYRDVRYMFDNDGELYGLRPSHKHRVLVDAAVPNGKDATSKGCGTWNEAAPGVFSEPETKGGTLQSVFLSAFSDHFVIVRCMSDKELAAGKDARLADASVRRFLGAATGQIRINCNRPELADANLLAEVLQHECGHLLGISHSKSGDPFQPTALYPYIDTTKTSTGPVPINIVTKDSLKRAWDPATSDTAYDCVKGFNPLLETDPCGGDPCCGSDDPCCGTGDPCCGSDDPCCGSDDPCCGSNDPCCGTGDVCCGLDEEQWCYCSGDHVFDDGQCYTCQSMCNYCEAVLGDCEQWIMDSCGCSS